MMPKRRLSPISKIQIKTKSILTYAAITPMHTSSIENKKENSSTRKWELFVELLRVLQIIISYVKCIFQGRKNLSAIV